MLSKRNRITTDVNNRLVVSGFKGPADRGSGIFHEALVEDQGKTKQLRRLVVDGKWELTPEHDLKLHVLGSNYGDLSGKTIILKGELEQAGKDSLSFTIREHENYLGVNSGSITLKGKWQADRYNRVTFRVAKGRGRYDTLTFQSAWQVNRNNELVYVYKKTHLKTRIKNEKVLIFRGYWDIARGKLTYRFDHSFDSYFEFKADFKTRNLNVLDREIKFTVGLTVRMNNTPRKITQTLIIRGGWQIKKGLKTVFEVTYSGGRRSKFEFGIQGLVAANKKIEVSLTSKTGEPLGIKLELTKKFNNDAELFLELSRAGKESRVIGGIKVKF